MDRGYLKQVFWSNGDALSFVTDTRENVVEFVFMGVNIGVWTEPALSPRFTVIGNSIMK